MPIKKLFKSVSKVANKIADKIVPKEIAPLLPLAAPFIAPLLPTAAGAGLGSFLGSARFLVPQALAALGSAKTTGEINPISQGLAALSSYASMPKDFTPAEQAYMSQNKELFQLPGGPGGIGGGLNPETAIPGQIIPEGFDTSTLDLSFADRARSAVGSAGQQLKDAFDAPGIKGILTKGTLGGSAALSDQAIKELQNFQAQQEADALAAEEAAAAYEQNISDLRNLYSGFLNFPVAGLNMAEGGIASVAPGMPKNMQVDGRDGTFIPMGVREKADDVPAMLSKNEFVMTADAVRGMGGGNVEVGAQRMYDLMNNLEARV